MNFHKPTIKRFFNSQIIKKTDFAIHTNSNPKPCPQSAAAKCRCSSGSETYDMGNAPISLDLASMAKENSNFRTALWTGKNLQLTVMSIPKGDEIGEEMHDSLDQFIYIVSGEGEVDMYRIPGGACTTTKKIAPGNAILIPSGTYHNVKNTSLSDMKLFSIYAPKAHKFGTVDITKPPKAN